MPGVGTRVVRLSCAACYAPVSGLHPAVPRTCRDLRRLCALAQRLLLLVILVPRRLSQVLIICVNSAGGFERGLFTRALRCSMLLRLREQLTLIRPALGRQRNP